MRTTLAKLGGVASAAFVLALIAASSAGAAGPWLGTATNGVGFTATSHAGSTLLSDGSHSLLVKGKWGIPRVTLDNGVGGLSADGRTLVLAQDDVAHNNGELSSESSFAVLSTKPLHLRKLVTVKGDFGFDALSPHGTFLYLIQHVSQENLFRYRVRAYDLHANRLLSRVIADKSQRRWLMDGYPVARASSADGRWVYTLYSNSNNYPFVHALDSVNRTAVCVGIPWDWSTDQQAINNATLTVKGGTLAISGRFALDRTTFKVRKL
jgi:hypothetical protein